MTLTDSEGNTPINNAISERNFSLIPIFQNYVFEQKIETKMQKRRLQAKSDNSPYLRVLNDAMRGLSIPKSPSPAVLTPNKTHFNFNDTSPFYINITRRKQHLNEQNERSRAADSKGETGANEAGKPTATADGELSRRKINRRTISLDPDLVKADGKSGDARNAAESSLVTDDNDYISLLSDDEVDIVQENLFQLTKGNLEKHLSMAPKKNRVSLVNTWRRKVNESRKRETIVPLNEVELDSFISRCTRDIDAVSSSTPATGTTVIEAKAKGTSRTEPQTDDNESFITALNVNTRRNGQDETYVVNTCQEGNTVVQMEENYMHTDAENDVVFYERKFVANPVEQNIGRRSRHDDDDDDVVSLVTTETSFSVPLDYDTDALRKELTHIGVAPGPITKSTKRLYLKRLLRHKRRFPQGAPAASQCVTRAPSKFWIKRESISF